MKMTRKQFNETDFETLITMIAAERDDVSHYDTLRNFIKSLIDEDKNRFALHLLESVYNDAGEGQDWWLYDYKMGLLDKPMSISSKDDIEELCLIDIAG